MVGLFETTFATTVSTALPPGISIDKAISILHDCETLSSLSANWRKSERRPPPSSTKQPSSTPHQEEYEFWEVEEDVPWIPKWLWRNGTAKYHLDFLPTTHGCDVTIRASSLFSSTNHWRLLRGKVLENGDVQESEGSGWVIQTVSNAVCNRTFAGFLKGHNPASLKAVHLRFIDKLQEGSVS